MSTTLTNLIERAQRNKEGKAVLNGRITEWGGYKGPLEEKYAIALEGNAIVRLRHWGTETLVINTVTKEILDYYGESNSDRDSMNFVLDYFDMPKEVGRFVHRPVNGGFFLDK